MDGSLKFGITIATYQRPDGECHVQRAIDSVLNQTYSNWKLFVIGDNHGGLLKDYLDEKEFICDLPFAVGRDNGLVGEELWRVGGAAAMNFALNMQQVERFDIHAHLDDDDYWLPDHLETLAEIYGHSERISFVFTQAKREYKGDVFPSLSPVNSRYPFEPRLVFPRANGLIHSTASWRLRHIYSMYCMIPDEPADSNLWSRISNEILRMKGMSVFIPKATVVRPTTKKYIDYKGDENEGSK